MIKGWRGLINALDHMFELRREYERLRSPHTYLALTKVEAEIAACVAQRKEEWAQEDQQDLFNKETK